MAYYDTNGKSFVMIGDRYSEFNYCHYLPLYYIASAFNTAEKV